MGVGLLYGDKKTGRAGTCATTKIIIDLFTSKQYMIIARVRSRKAQKAQIRYYTPLLDLVDYNGQAKTPQRSAVFALRAFARKRSIEIKVEEVRDITSVLPRN